MAFRRPKVDMVAGGGDIWATFFDAYQKVSFSTCCLLGLLRFRSHSHVHLFQGSDSSQGTGQDSCSLVASSDSSAMPIDPANLCESKGCPPRKVEIPS